MLVTFTCFLLLPIAYADSPPSRPTSFYLHRPRIAAASICLASKVRSYFVRPFAIESSRESLSKVPLGIYDVVDNAETTDVYGGTESGSNSNSTDAKETECRLTTTPTQTATFATRSLARPLSIWSLSSFPSSRSLPHTSIILVCVGSAIGVTLLILFIVFVVLCWRRRTNVFPQLRTSIRPDRWFYSKEKDDLIVSIHVTPPTVPLKGILLRRSSSTSPSSGYLRPDRVSLSSSQFSVIINNLPRTYASDLGIVPLPQKPLHTLDPPRAARIGPSPSELFSNLLGQERNLPSSNRLSNHTLSPPSSCQQPSALIQPLDRFLTRTSELHTQQPAIPPSLVVSSGPRGHGLVPTSDKRIPSPSFAYWRYQNSLAK